MPVTAATAAAATGAGSTDRPARAVVVTGPTGRIAIVASTGSRSSGRRAAVTAATSADSSSTTRGSIVGAFHRLAELGQRALGQAGDPATRHRLVHQRVHVRPTPEVRVRDRDVTVGRAQHDPAVLVRIGGGNGCTRLGPVQAGQVRLAHVDTRQDPSLVARVPGEEPAGDRANQHHRDQDDQQGEQDAPPTGGPTAHGGGLVRGRVLDRPDRLGRHGDLHVGHAR